jgi:hypothetical protein
VSKHQAAREEESAAPLPFWPILLSLRLGRLRLDGDDAELRVKPSQIVGVARDDRKA